MESSMVTNSSSESYNELVKEFFRRNLPTFQVIKESTHGPFWHISLLVNDDVKIVIEGDVGFYVVVEIEGEKLDLWKYDKSINDHGKTTRENILYQLQVLKKFLS